MNADNNNDEEWLDADIRALDLSYVEKSGLQVYRNYSNSFEREAIQRFRQAIEKEKADVGSVPSDGVIRARRLGCGDGFSCPRRAD